MGFHLMDTAEDPAPADDGDNEFWWAVDPKDPNSGRAPEDPGSDSEPSSTAASSVPVPVPATDSTPKVSVSAQPKANAPSTSAASSVPVPATDSTPSVSDSAPKAEEQT
jgi:hypothetical protein